MRELGSRKLPITTPEESQRYKKTIYPHVLQPQRLQRSRSLVEKQLPHETITPVTPEESQLYSKTISPPTSQPQRG